MLDPSCIGILNTSPVRSLPAWQALSGQVESAGFGALYAPDHVGEGSVAPIPALCVAATTTRSMRLGPLMLNNEVTHPTLISRDIATLQILSGGRAELGIGAGWLRGDLAALGRRLDDASDRLSRLAECVAAVRGVLTADLTRWEGAHYRFTLAGMNHAAPQSLPPPITIGGGGPRVLGLAAMIADKVSINPNLASGALGAEAFRSATMSNLSRQLAMISKVAADHGRHPKIQLMIPYVGVDDHATKAAAAFAARSGLAGSPAQDCPHVLIGTAEHAIAKLVRMRHMGVHQFVVRDVALAEIRALFPAVGPLRSQRLGRSV